jgi:hypothetical protein
MAKIVKIDPLNWNETNVVQVDVVADSSAQAIDAIEQWACENGFARVRESVLRPIIRPDRQRVYRGACYRLTEEERQSIEYRVDETSERAMRISGAHEARVTRG